MEYEQGRQQEQHSSEQRCLQEIALHQVSVVAPVPPEGVPGTLIIDSELDQRPDLVLERNSAQKSQAEEQNDTQLTGSSKTAGGHKSDTARKSNETSSRKGREDSSRSSGGMFSSWFSGQSDHEKRLERLHDELSIKNKKMERLERKNEELQVKNKDLVRRIRELDHSAMTTIDQQKQDIKARDERLLELEGQISSAQLAMNKKSARPRIDLADDEGTMKGNFMNLHDEVKKWSKAWGSAPFSVVDNLTSQEREGFLRQLGEVVVLENGQIPHTLKTWEMSIRSSVLCVSAMLGRYICANVIEAPFRPLRSLITQARSMPQISEYDQWIQQDDTKLGIFYLYEKNILTDVYNTLASLNLARAQIWRSEMINILDPKPGYGTSEAGAPGQAEAETRRKQTARELAADFLNEGVDVLLPRVGPEDWVKRNEPLQSIFQKALEVSGRLWKQLTIMKCSYLEELRHEPFTSKSELMDAHAYHKLDLDEESETRLDHHPIRIICFPAIKVYGTSTGENYHQDRVWGKAIVWLDE